MATAAEKRSELAAEHEHAMHMFNRTHSVDSEVAVGHLRRAIKTGVELVLMDSKPARKTTTKKEK